MEGAALKAFREDAGLSQAEASKRYGVGRTAWAMYETGQRAVPPNLAAAILGQPSAPIENRPEALLIKAAKIKPESPKAAAAAVADVAKAAMPLSAKIKAYVELGAPRLYAEWFMRNGARRPTAAELAAEPAEYAGPNVWLIDKPGEARLILKFSTNGQGQPSIRRPGDPGFVPNLAKSGGDNPKAPPPGRRKAA